MASTQKQVGRAATLVIALAGALLMAPKCGNDITVPLDDRTPPVASLAFYQGAESGRVSERGETRTLKAGELLSVRITGQDDDGGVRRVTLVTTEELLCSAGTLVETRRDETTRNEVDDVGAGQLGNTEIQVSAVLGGKIECASGGQPRSRKYTVSGSAENHAGAITTTPTLVVVVNR
jgi:hypothetical protein